MATGIPLKNAASKRSKMGGATLAYPGKRSEEEILATPPASLRPVHEPRTIAHRLFQGDNLPILAALLPELRGEVRLVAIDPPFATRSTFQSRKQVDAYDDALTGAAWLEFLRERLVFLRELLADDGSIYLHLDQTMAFHAKVLMDEIFGESHFRNFITRKKCNPKNYTRNTYGNVSDHVLFYTKTKDYVWNRPVEKWDEARAAREYPCVDEHGRSFKKVPVHAPGTRRGETGKPWRGKAPPPGKHWQFPPRVLDDLDARGEIYWSPTGNPRRKVYLDGSPGVAVQDIWLDAKDAHNQNSRITGYPTEKPRALLERIVLASSNPGDLVLDAFAGSGTTLEVAGELGRRWIGIDASPVASRTILDRLEHGTDRMGDFVKGSRGSRGRKKRGFEGVAVHRGEPPRGRNERDGRG